MNPWPSGRIANGLNHQTTKDRMLINVLCIIFFFNLLEPKLSCLALSFSNLKWRKLKHDLGNFLPKLIQFFLTNVQTILKKGLWRSKMFHKSDLIFSSIQIGSNSKWMFFFPLELTFNVLKVLKFTMRFKAFIKASTRLFWFYEIFNNYNFWLKYYNYLLLNH
jgi:hypothetical protein